MHLKFAHATLLSRAPPSPFLLLYSSSCLSLLSHVCVGEMLLNSEIVLQNAQLQVGRVALQMWEGKR